MSFVVLVIANLKTYKTWKLYVNLFFYKSNIPPNVIIQFIFKN